MFQPETAIYAAQYTVLPLGVFEKFICVIGRVVRRAPHAVLASSSLRVSLRQSSRLYIVLINLLFDKSV